MKILVVSEFGEGLGLAHRMSLEGHMVSVFTRAPNIYRSGLGLYEKVESWRPVMDKADFIIFDGPGWGKYEKVVRSRGKITLGCNQLADLITKDEEKKLKILDMADMSLCSNFEHLVSYMGFFNGIEWVKPFLVFHRDVGLFQDGMGPKVHMGASGKPVQESPLDDLAEPLKKMGYIGFATIIWSIDDDQPVEFYLTLDHDGLTLLSEGLSESLTKVLFSLANGTAQEVPLGTDYLISVNMSVPPWPYMYSNWTEGDVIEGIVEENEKHLYLGAVEKEKDQYRAVPCAGILLRATAHSKSIRDAQRRVYRTLKNIEVADKQYRLDIGDDLNLLLEMLYNGPEHETD